MKTQLNTKCNNKKENKVQRKKFSLSLVVAYCQDVDDFDTGKYPESCMVEVLDFPDSYAELSELQKYIKQAMRRNRADSFHIEGLDLSCSFIGQYTDDIESLFLFSKKLKTLLSDIAPAISEIPF
ncbi:MAG: hypothetical protein AAGA18_13910 [Verrucomicrobiota bacterium]